MIRFVSDWHRSTTHGNGLISTLALCHIPQFASRQSDGYTPQSIINSFFICYIAWFPVGSKWGYEAIIRVRGVAPLPIDAIERAEASIRVCPRANDLDPHCRSACTDARPRLS